MTIKTTRHFLCFALLMAFGLKAAEETAAPKLSMSNLSGVPTPLEEYGLSIGDITVTRVINPLGQLKQGSPIMLARRIQNITNTLYTSFNNVHQTSQCLNLHISSNPRIQTNLHEVS